MALRGLSRVSTKAPQILGRRALSEAASRSSRPEADPRLNLAWRSPQLALRLNTAQKRFASSPASSAAITEAEVIAAQKAWGEGIVDIGAAKDSTERALRHIDELYAYEQGPVLFKPTKAAQVQFRGDRTSALAYFVGGNTDFPEDKGFALAPWTAVRFENTGMHFSGDTATAMGNYYFTDNSGGETKVEYTFSYRKHGESLRIFLHHSSIPYSG